jgi:hypothetical protein
MKKDQENNEQLHQQQGQQREEPGKSLPSDGPVSKAEGTDSPDLNDNDTAKSFDRDQEELNYGFKDGDLDTNQSSS